jgi:hypothetical protein
MTVKQALDAWQNESLKHAEEEGYTVKGNDAVGDSDGSVGAKSL